MLAGFAEGRLSPGEREAFLDHADRCDACREVSLALAASPGVRATAAAASRPRRRALAIAAAVAVAVGTSVFLAVRGSRGSRDSLEDVAALAAALRAEDPALFADFVPLRDEDLRPAPVERGGFVVRTPAGRIVERRPGMEWEPVAGATRYDVSVLDEEGVRLWSGASAAASIAWPHGVPDAREGGRYVVEVVARAPVEETARRAFDVASAADRARFDLAMASIERRGGTPLAALAKAHFALRAGWLAAADASLARYLAARPDDARALSLRRHLDGVLGRR